MERRQRQRKQWLSVGDIAGERPGQGGRKARNEREQKGEGKGEEGRIRGRGKMESEKEGGSKPAGEPTLVNSLCSPRPGAQGPVSDRECGKGGPLSRKEPIPRSSVALGCGSPSPLAPESVCTCTGTHLCGL